ncbi:MAG: alpha/beta fold hydrolase, partial [Pseudobdellovibrionaceae bacterium]
MHQTDFLKRLDWPAFEPHPFLPTGFLQTVASTFWPHLPDKTSAHLHDITLDDGDVIRVVENTPPGWKDGDRLVLAVHGLAGAHTSTYMIRITHQLLQKGIAVFRINLRGCGVGGGLAKNPYHSGRSEDSRTVLKWLKQKFPRSPVTQVGYSLGANMTLKMVGEDSDSPAGNLDQFVAVSPPVDLAKSAVHMQSLRNLFFDQFFVWRLK